MGNANGFRRTGDGLYEGNIGGVHVRVTRGTVGTNRYGDYSRAVEWKARANGRVIADGHSTMSGAIAQARRALGVDPSVSGNPPTEAERHARAVDIAAERAAREGNKNRTVGRRVAAWRKKSTGNRIL